jgi:[ribosomal protein S5]-alanine N-acetyltransferase
MTTLTAEAIHRAILYTHPSLAETIETHRLWLRPFMMQDYWALHQIYSDIVLMQHIDDGARTPTETLNELCDFISAFQDDRCGKMAVIDKDLGELIGRGGIYFRRDRSDYPQVGFVLRHDYHGLGLGTEIAQASLRYGFLKHQFQRIEAYVLPLNAVSQHILSKKLGMRLETKRFYYQGHTYYRYALELTEYLEQLYEQISDISVGDRKQGSLELQVASF